MLFTENALNLIKSEGKHQPIDPNFMSKVAAKTNESLHNEDWFSFNSNFEEDNQKEGDIGKILQQNPKNNKALSEVEPTQKLGGKIQIEKDD